jgi:hypothetical protein
VIPSPGGWATLTANYNEKKIYSGPNGIIALGGKSLKIFEFKGFIRKILWNKGLALQRSDLFVQMKNKKGWGV